jgi:Skp family chaperone for outer membrane proteins
MAEDDEYDDYSASSGPGVVSVLLPFATAGGALAVGILVGGIIAWLIKPAVEVEVPRDLTKNEIDAICAPAVDEKQQALDAAADKVEVLTADVQEREAKLQDLEAEMTRRSERGRAMHRELEAAKAELEQVKMELAIALEEKHQLEVELTATVAQLEETEEKLDHQVTLTERAKEDALTNKWHRFLNDAQLEVCEKGNRKRLGQCRETVLAKLTASDVRDKFAHCVRSAQATPTVHEVGRDESLPDYSQYLDQNERVVKDWYVLLCDPTLPEADGFTNEEHLPPTAAQDPTWDMPDDDPFDLDAIDDLPEEEG